MTNQTIPQTERPQHDPLAGEFMDAPCSEWGQRQNRVKGHGYAQQARIMTKLRTRPVPSAATRRYMETRTGYQPGQPLDTAQVRWLPDGRLIFFFRDRGVDSAVIAEPGDIIPATTIDYKRLEADALANSGRANDRANQRPDAYPDGDEAPRNPRA